MRDKAEIFADLAKPLPAELVSSRADNRDSRKSLIYIEGHDAIDQANKVFGFDGWGTEILDIEYRELARGDKPTGMYLARIQITVEGFRPKSDVGVGLTAGFSPDAHETAVKAAITDGIKRALRQFGNQFGNSLYDKENPLGEEQPQPQQPRPAAPPAVRPTPKPATAGPMPTQLNEFERHRTRLGWDGERLVNWVKSRSEGRGPREISAEEAADALNALGNIPTPGQQPAQRAMA